jgi:hypothetical protein
MLIHLPVSAFLKKACLDSFPKKVIQEAADWAPSPKLDHRQIKKEVKRHNAMDGRM